MNPTPSNLFRAFSGTVFQRRVQSIKTLKEQGYSFDEACRITMQLHPNESFEEMRDKEVVQARIDDLLK